ncbi:ATP-dependent RNA helicase DDX51-like [Nematostella vectensis]|uniref:ATP-dependent RNA helicase DDX51-like n=1 Tax=Nematostella vectensis TaxID=45351 RepID=UPI002076D7D3|nr:ATP-dependent RNA helicase DDX51-like [Nematostella vectensis]
MDLFRIERYLGDEESPAKSGSFSIKEHIAQRRRSLRKLSPKINNNSQQNIQQVPNLGDEKKAKDTIENEDSKRKRHKDKDHDEELEVKRKKKKSKSTKVEVEQLEEELLDLGEIESIKKVSQRGNEEGESKDGDNKGLEKDLKIENTDINGVRQASGFTVIGRNKRKKKIHNVQRTLPGWLSNPEVISPDFDKGKIPVSSLQCLSTSLQKKLKEQDINSFFPVQSSVIPAILSNLASGTLAGLGGYRPSDICVSAPTGSGKTLAYVLPLVQAISQCTVCHLQALVLLPTKDLANQVKRVFDTFIQGTSVRVGLAPSNKTLQKEQDSLVGRSCGSTSHVNILVTTPGRLVEHISSTPGFTLQHLRFLVIDEADRLLDQSYNNWLSKVIHAAQESVNTLPLNDSSSFMFQLGTKRKHHRHITAASYSKIQVPLQKLLFSATMTHSPEKLAALQLYNPMLFAVSNTPEMSAENDEDAAGTSRYSLPVGLTDHMAVCKNGEKPLMVLFLLLKCGFKGVLCFTSSLEATHRLYLLIKLYGEVAVAEYSSSLTPQQRRGILRDFKQGAIQIIICSDAMARGMDIDNVSYVISYDAPNHAKGYIHRVGRTARAGNQGILYNDDSYDCNYDNHDNYCANFVKDESYDGTAVTLLHSDEVFHFKILIQKTGRHKIPKYRVKESELETLIEKYKETLTKLEQTILEERNYGHRTRTR